MTTAAKSSPEFGFLGRLLNRIEKVGNAIPNPALLFVGFAVVTLILSAIVSWSGLSVVHPGTGETVKAVNLLSVDGLHRILTGLVTNFTGFAPLGVVLVGIMGIAVAEASGLISAVLRALVLSAPRRLLTVVVIFAGVMSNMASDIGYVVLIPLSAMIFLAVGRHPLVGLAAAFAGVSGGFHREFAARPYRCSTGRAYARGSPDHRDSVRRYSRFKFLLHGRVDISYYRLGSLDDGTRDSSPSR